MNNKDLQIFLSEDCTLDLIYVEGGKYKMGDEHSEYDDERPVHEVQLNSFYLMKYPLTQRAWKSVTRDNPSDFKGEERPVERVSWDDVQDFIAKLNEKTGKAFRLPSESEWEYAARGGIYSQGYTYAGSDKLGQVGWYADNSNGETREVGRKLANELGLYDTSGNVWEWCEDDRHENYENAPEDGSAWIYKSGRGDGRVFRGGSCFSDPIRCRLAYRDWRGPDFRSSFIGFRLALSI